MSVKLSGTLADEQWNGMDRLTADLVRHPEERHVIVAVVDCGFTKVTHSPDGPIYTPTARILFVEPVTDQESTRRALDILGAHRSERLGEAELDIDFGVADPLRDVMDRAAGGARVTFFDIKEANDGN